MLTIGCHLSISRGLHAAGLEAVSIGANTFQFFTRNPRGGKAKAVDPDDVNKLRYLMEKHQFGPLFAHASYTMNLCSDQEKTRAFSRMILQDDLERLAQWPESLYIFHPGSHVGQGTEKGIQLIVEALNEVLPHHQGSWILLEGMSGKGSEIGGTLEELKAIMDGVQNPDRLGICLDSCHLYAAGYDVVTNLDGVLDEVDRVVGLDRLRAFHLNDSQEVFASHKDRHATLGTGTLGMEAITRIVNHPRLRKLPFNLETPNELEGYQQEIEMMRNAFRTE